LRKVVVKLDAGNPVRMECTGRSDVAGYRGTGKEVTIL
jgi:hypothetical protein